MMQTTRRALLVVLAWAGPALAQTPAPQPGAEPPLPRVAIVTTAGTLTVEVEVKRAPITAANFLRYVDQKRLDGVSFYRIVKVGPEFGFVQFGAGAGHDLGGGAVCGGKFQGAGTLSRVEQAVAGVLGACGVKNTPHSALTCEGILCEQVQGLLRGGGIRREQHTRQALTQRRGDALQGVLVNASERGGVLAERFNHLGCGADTQLAQLGGAGFGQGGFRQFC